MVVIDSFFEVCRVVGFDLVDDFPARPIWMKLPRDTAVRFPSFVDRIVDVSAFAYFRFAVSKFKISHKKISILVRWRFYTIFKDQDKTVLFLVSAELFVFVPICLCPLVAEFLFSKFQVRVEATQARLIRERGRCFLFQH